MEFELNKEGLKDFINVFKTLNKSLTETQISINDKGLNLIQLDNANVCLFEINITEGFFLAYKTDKPLIIRFNNKEFLNYLKNFKEYLKVIINETDITLKDNKQIYNLKLIEIVTQETKKPIMEHNFKTEIEGLKDFFKALKTYSGFKDYVTIETDKNLLLTQEDNKYLLKELSNNTINVKCKYSLDYLLNLTSLKDLKAKFHLSTDYPLMIEFLNNYKTLKITYILAPRIDTD